MQSSKRAVMAAAHELLSGGLHAQSQAEVASALQIFFNAGCLKQARPDLPFFAVPCVQRHASSGRNEGTWPQLRLAPSHVSRDVTVRNDGSDPPCEVCIRCVQRMCGTATPMAIVCECPRVNSCRTSV